MKKLLSPVKKLWVIMKARPVTSALIISLSSGLATGTYLFFSLPRYGEISQSICCSLITGAGIFLLSFFITLSSLGERLRTDLIMAD